jgi:hypothetical protein
MGFFEDLNDNVTGFFGGSSADKARKNRERVNAYKGANKPLPSIQSDLRNKSALTVPSKTSLSDLVNKNTMKPGEYSNPQYQNPRYANKQQFDEANYSGPSPQEVSQKSLFDELLGKITSDWSGPDKKKIDYSPLDNALNSRMDALKGLRDKSQQNFEKSDVALEGMHRAQQERMGTEGVNRYNSIADTQKSNLQADNQGAQDYLAKIKSDDMAKRTAMLQNLGLTDASAASHDVSADPINEAIGSIASRNEANQTTAEQNRGSNLAFNQGVINSVGQQGVERRGDLAQQLQAIFGKIDMASADAQNENAQQRFQLEQNAGNQQYQQWRDQKGFMQDTLGMMQEDARARDEMAMKAQTQKPASIPGFEGVGQSLLNSGYEVPEVQNALGILSNITAGDYRKGIDPNAGYSDVSILNKRLQEQGISPMLAIQLATNYANLGNTSKYDQSPY